MANRAASRTDHEDSAHSVALPTQVGASAGRSEASTAGARGADPHRPGCATRLPGYSTSVRVGVWRRPDLSETAGTSGGAGEAERSELCHRKPAFSDRAPVQQGVASLDCPRERLDHSRSHVLVRPGGSAAVLACSGTRPPGSAGVELGQQPDEIARLDLRCLPTEFEKALHTPAGLGIGDRVVEGLGLLQQTGNR